MAFAFFRKHPKPLSPEAWEAVKAFHAEIRTIVLVKHGKVLTSATHRRHNPGVSETDWMAVQVFELFEDVREKAGAQDLDALDPGHRHILLMTTLAANGTQEEFDSALKADRLGMAAQMRGLRDGWAWARSMPAPRALPGESPAAMLARFNRGLTLEEAYTTGREALISGRFTDNDTQLFLLPYAVQRGRALGAQIPCVWRNAPGFRDLHRAERDAVGLMYRTLCISDDVLDLMDEVLDAPPNGDVVMERIKMFHNGATQLALTDSVTAELPAGRPGSVHDMTLTAFDTGFRLLDEAMVFYAARNGA